MTVSEIFSRINAHMVEGMMLHDEMANYYDFLGLMGFKRLHEYQFFKESAEMRGISRYYTNHYNMLIKKSEINYQTNIPSTWYNYNRKQVDSGTKRNAIKSAMEKWCAWELETKKMYESMYSQLCSMNEIAAACKVKELIKDVDMELKRADRLHIKLQSMDYDLITIVLMQDKMHEHYDEKSKHIGVNIC